jgi:hypothetical protein
MWRRLGVWAATLAVAGGLAACSSGPSSTPASSSQTLSASDLPTGWLQAGIQAPVRSSQLQQFSTCLHGVVPEHTHSTGSTIYRNSNGARAFSFTVIFPAKSLAHSAYATWQSASFLACGEPLVPYIFSVLGPGKNFGELSTYPGKPLNIGDAAISHRFVLAVTSGSTTSHVTADLLSVLHDNKITTITFVSSLSGSPTHINEGAVARALVG